MTTRLLVLTIAMLFAAPTGASASCIRETEAEQSARAQVVVEGVILHQDATGKTLVSVQQYLKGSGPEQLTLAGAGGAGVVTSVDISPQPGERWRLLGTLNAGELSTTQCDGSAVIAGSDAATSGPAPAAGDAASSGPAPVAAVSDATSAPGDDAGFPTLAVVVPAVAALLALAAGGLAWRRRRHGGPSAAPDEHLSPGLPPTA